MQGFLVEVIAWLPCLLMIFGNVLHISDSYIPDDKTLKMIKRVAVTLALELSEDIEYLDCSDVQKEAISLLAAIYMVCYLIGVSAAGLNFSVGDLTSSTSTVPNLMCYKLIMRFVR